MIWTRRVGEVNEMAKYIIKNALMVIPTMLAVVFIIFTINHLTPGDPVAIFYDFDYTEEQYAEKAAEWGLDQPFLIQFVNYVKNIVTKFDFGYSYYSGNSVMSELSTRFPVSLQLGLISVLLTVIIGVPFGIVSATRQYSMLDYGVTFVSLFDASHGRIRSRAIDDRAGCAILIDLMKKDLPYDCTFVFAVQEEVGLRGSKTAAFAAEPEAAIVVESTTAADIPGVEPEKQVCHVGKGPVLSFMDRATIYDREYFALAKKLAAEKGIPCQVKEAVAGGNDAGAIHVSRGGVRTAAVSLACRYLHSPVGMIAEEDFHHAEELIEAMAMAIAGGEAL